MKTYSRRQILNNIALSFSLVLLTPQLSVANQETLLPNINKTTRLLALNGALTESIYALGMGKQLVGRDITSVFPPDALSLPSIGYARHLSIESVMSVKPNLVLAEQETVTSYLKQNLSRANIQLKIFDSSPTIAAAKSKLIDIAKMTCNQNSNLNDPCYARLNGLVHVFEKTWQQANQIVLAKPPKALFIFAGGQGKWLIAGRDTPAHAILEISGIQNAFASHSGFIPVSNEAILAAQPEVIITTNRTITAMGGKAQFLAAPFFKTSNNQNLAKNLLYYDDLFLLGFGPRTPNAVLSLKKDLRKIFSN